MKDWEIVLTKKNDEVVFRFMIRWEYRLLFLVTVLGLAVSYVAS